MIYLNHHTKMSINILCLDILSVAIIKESTL